MKADDELMIKYLLQADECREGQFAPKEYFSITSGIFNLLKSLESAEINFRLGTIEADIISFCALNADNKSLKSYICELRELLLSDFTMEKLQQCEIIFADMRNMYMKEYAKSIMLMEVGLCKKWY